MLHSVCACMPKVAQCAIVSMVTTNGYVSLTARDWLKSESH